MELWRAPKADEYNARSRTTAMPRPWMVLVAEPGNSAPLLRGLAPDRPLFGRVGKTGFSSSLLRMLRSSLTTQTPGRQFAFGSPHPARLPVQPVMSNVTLGITN